MECIKAKRKECLLTGCYHNKKHRKDNSCIDTYQRCDWKKPCVKLAPKVGDTKE